MANGDRDKIFKSWSGISEVALIKEVATKGEHIQLCMQYWARKRKMSIADYELIFHDVVQTYANRLLSERLVCKAENVLRNVQRDVRCFYYQFACESNDQELRELIMEHLSKREPCDDYDQQMDNLKFHWELLQQLKKSETIMSNIKKYMRRANLESLMSLDAASQQRLMIELYFENRNEILLQHINKFVMWDFLVETMQTEEIIKWCKIHQTPSTDLSPTHDLTELESKYAQWSIETEMYEYALRSFQDSDYNTDDVLRNCFALAGFFFSDERNSVPTILQRICVTESFNANSDQIKALPLAQFIFDEKFYYLLMYDFVGNRQLEELNDKLSEHSPLIKLLVALKTNSLQNLDGFKEISFYTTKYLESIEVDFEQEQALATLFEFLTNEPSISNLQCAATSGPLKSLKYLNAMLHHHQQNEITIEQSLPTVYVLLKTFKNIDFKRLKKDANIYEKLTQQSKYQSQGRPDQEGNAIKLQYTHRLNFLHYIRQSRCAYAVYLMLMEQLQNYAQITKAHMFSACESVYELAFQTSPTDTEVIIHCIAFSEMLGFDTQQLRCFLKLKQFLTNTETKSDHLQDNQNFASIIQQTERLLVQRLDNENIFPLNEYTAIMSVTSITATTATSEEINANNQGSLVMQHYAQQNDYWRLLVLLQFFEMPLEKVKQLVKYFTTPTMGDHLLRALAFATQSSERNSSLKRRSSLTRRQLKHQKYHKKGADKSAAVTTSIETITSSFASCNEAAGAINDLEPNNDRFVADCTNGGPDLFALILLHTNAQTDNEPIIDITKFLECIQQKNRPTRQSSVVNFLRTAVEQHLSVMAVMAASICQKDDCSNLEWCWLVWLSVTTSEWNTVLRLAVGNSIQEFPWNLIEQLVRQCQITALVRSFTIFYPTNALLHLFNFLQLTIQAEFGDRAVHELRLYGLAWSNDDVRLPLNPWSKREKLMRRTIRLLLLHLQHNFESVTDQLKFLACVCKSGLSDLTGQLDFCLLRGFCDILQLAGSGATQRFPLNFVQLTQNEQGDVKEYERVLNCVLAAKEYDVAVRLATLLHKPISGIVYSKWANSLEQQLSLHTDGNYLFPFEQYEQEVSSHSLPPEILVNFLLYASSHLPSKAYKSRYNVLQKALNVIKHHHLFPNESFDRDQIEYDMIINYLLLNEGGNEDDDDLPLYHSEYYEEIMLSERCVLFKSFLELKELAGIEDLNISNKIQLDERQKSRLESLLHRLLDDGDIVEALRLQELFDVRPLDLRFIVFCMALAESMSNIYAMSSDERQLLGEVERSSFSKFTKRTLCAGGTGGGGGGSGGCYLSDSCSTLEFEEIPSKEKQETLAILQGIASKLKFGITIAKRVICCYRAAMYLDKEYLDVLRTKDVQILLQSIAEEGCLHRLLVVSDILTSTHMEPQEIAELLSFEITTAVVRPRFYIFSPDQQAKLSFRNADLWGYNIDRDLHLFLELTPDRTKLGACLLEYCDALKAYRKFQYNKPYERNIYFERLAEIIARYGQPNIQGSVNSNLNSNDSSANTPNSSRPAQVLSHKKQNIIYVELLIKAHQSFVHECSMEGIANVLNRAKVLNSTLAQAKSWSLIVRMLIGIGRYREMFFCFDTLIENEQFESLLGQFDEEKTIGLRQAILAYLRDHCAPEQGKELFKLAALNFLMYKDLAELWEQDAQEILNKIHNTAQSQEDTITGLRQLRTNAYMMNLLNQSLEYYVHATENYLLDNKLLLAQKSASQAELTAMQIDLAQKALEKVPSSNGYHMSTCVIKLKSREHFKILVNNELSVSQSLILSRAYGYDINWSEALLNQFVFQLKSSYLNDFLQQIDITDDVIENVVKSFQVHCQNHKINKRMEDHIAELIDLIQSVTLKYKLASVLTLKSTIISLINDETIHYLRDMKFGRREENRNT